jgi:hypothetical protein
MEENSQLINLLSRNKRKSKLQCQKSRSNFPKKKIEHIDVKDVNVEIPDKHFVYKAPEITQDFALVDQKMQLEPKLKKYQEQQVKGTVEATKKILEEGQWKQVEKNVADALTENEKECLKQKYYLDLAKVNWQKLEDKLRLSYNNINWEKVNTQLNTAITTIKLIALLKFITLLSMI